MKRALSLLLLCGWALAAQSAATVEGKVVSSADGTPVRKATVLLRAPRLVGDSAAPDRDSYLAQTDAYGRFSVAGVAPGVYECVPSRAGFEAGPPDRSAKPVHLTVTEGQHFEGLVLRLAPLGAVSGRILDPEGQPVPNAAVTALQYAYSAHGKTLLARRNVTSDDRGEFRLFGLYPGTYYVRATPLEEGAVTRYSSFGPAGVNRNTGMFGPPRNQVRGPAPLPLMSTYYPSATGPAQARAFEVPAGGETRDSDIHLQRRSLYSIRGTAPAGVGTRVIIAQNRSDPAVRAQSAMAQTDGSFELHGLPSGSYVLDSLTMIDPRSGPPPEAARRFVRAFVEVADRDLEGVQFESSPELTVAGVVKNLGKTAVKLQGLAVSLQAPQGMTANVPAKADGSFLFTGILPDIYRVALSGPTPAYIISLKLGETELTESLLDLRHAANAASLMIAVSADFGSVDGKVTADDQPLAGATVSLIPGRSDGPDRYQEMDSDAEGRFLFPKVPLGTYRIFAWKDAPRGAPQDAEFRGPFEKLGVPIVVEANTQQTMELKAIDTERQR